MYDEFLGSPAARAACWSSDLIRFALITVLLDYNVLLHQREGEGVIESGIVSLSKQSRAMACIALRFEVRLCVSSRAEIQK